MAEYASGNHFPVEAVVGLPLTAVDYVLLPEQLLYWLSSQELLYWNASGLYHAKKVTEIEFYFPWY